MPASGVHRLTRQRGRTGIVRQVWFVVPYASTKAVPRLIVFFAPHIPSEAPLLFVGWTLIFEMFFYAVFAIALFAKQRFAVVAGASVFLVAFSVLLGPRGVVFLGDISYALYCTHLLSFSFVAWIVAKLAISPVGHAWAYFGAMLATGLVIAVGTYLMFEKPTTDFLKRLIERPRLPVNYSAVPQSPGKGGSL